MPCSRALGLAPNRARSPQVTECPYLCPEASVGPNPKESSTWAARRESAAVRKAAAKQKGSRGPENAWAWAGVEPATMRADSGAPLRIGGRPVSACHCGAWVREKCGARAQARDPGRAAPTATWKPRFSAWPKEMAPRGWQAHALNPETATGPARDGTRTHREYNRDCHGGPARDGTRTHREYYRDCHGGPARDGTRTHTENTAETATLSWV